jgi:hypothetical protein
LSAQQSQKAGRLTRADEFTEIARSSSISILQDFMPVDKFVLSLYINELRMRSVLDCHHIRPDLGQDLSVYLWVAVRRSPERPAFPVR